MMRAAAIALMMWAGAAAAQQDDPFELGLRLMKTGEAELALNAFNRALAQDGVSAPRLVGLSAAMYRLGRRGPALRVAKSAVDLDPNEPVARNNLGVILYDQGDIAAALTEFQRAYALTNGLDKRVATNLGITEHSLLRRDQDIAAQVDYDFDVIQFGHGVYRLEERSEEAAAPQGPDEENPS